MLVGFSDKLLGALLIHLVSPISVVQAAVSPPVFLLEWGGYGTGDGQFDTPMGIAVNESLDRVYVVDSFNNRIQYFNLNGGFGGAIGEYGIGPGQFNWPQGITLNPSTGTVYLADTINSRVQVFDQNLESPQAFGSYGVADGQFKRPYDVAVDAVGNYYVADTFNHRIQKFNGSNNAFIMKFGEYGTENGHFVRPCGVSVDLEGNIYVIDEMHRVQKFDATGNWLSTWGSFGAGEGQFNTPRDIDFDSAGNIYVADTGNQRVQKFTSMGVFVTQWGGYGTMNGQFNNPWGVVALDNDEVYIADTDNNRVQRFETNQTPTDISLSLATVFENRPTGTLVGNLAAVDSNLGDTFTYILAAGTGDADNAAFALSGPTLVTAQAFDFETDAEYSIRVRVTDSGGLFYEEALTVTIANDNDAPVVIGATFDVNENSAVGTVVGQVLVTDQDMANAGFTYAITGGTGSGVFEIDASGQILVANSAALDYESTTSFTLTVQATDDGSGSLTATTQSGTADFLINVLPVNDAPSLAGFSASIAENSANGTAVGQVTGSDPDIGQTLTYSITSGDDLGAFAINAGTGEVTVAKSEELDRETTPAYTLTITVVDNGTPKLSAYGLSTITLTDVNEFSPVMNDATVNDFPENSPMGTSVITMSATDGDTGSTFKYQIVDGNSSGAFAIDVDSGAITVANQAALNYESTPTFLLIIQVTDSGTPGLTDTATVAITLSNINEAPTVPAQGMAVAENSAGGAPVGQVLANDPDGVSSFTFAKEGGTGADLFDLSTDGAVTVASGAVLDFEGTSSYSLQVEVTDGGGLTGSGTVTINLTDVNEAPMLTPGQVLSVRENSGAGVGVGTVTGSDPDAGSSITFSVIGGSGETLFDLSAGGEVSVAAGASLNYEGDSSYTLEVRVMDNGTPGLTGSGTVTIEVEDENEAPVVTGNTFGLAENSLVDTMVGTLLGVADEDDTHFTWSISDGNPGTTFKIDNTGQIRVADPTLLNYEVPSPFFNLTARATDEGGLWGEAQVTINLTDVNDAPVVETETFSVVENSVVGTQVGKVTATDEDRLPTQTLAWAITDGNTGGAFGIDNTGQITVANVAPLDLETNPSFSLTVEVTDNGTPVRSGSATVTILLTNENEAPTLTGETFWLPENSLVDTLVGTRIAITDPDSASFTWSIPGGNELGAFAIDGSGQIRVADSGPLDLEKNPSFFLTVQAVDPGGLIGTATVIINLTNANEAPVVDDVTIDLAENSLAGTLVGYAPSTDPESNIVGWSIESGNSSGTFAIHPTTGAITVANPTLLDFEAPSVFSLTIRATDAGSLWDEGTVTINLTDVNEAPVVQTATYSISEVSPIGFVVGTALANDPDAGQVLSYAITGGNTGGAFDIDAVSGQISVADNASFDYPTTLPFTLTVTVTDNDATSPLSGTGTVTVNIMSGGDLELTSFTGSTVAVSGSTGLYSVLVTNIGPGASDPYNVEVTLPAPLMMAASGSTPGCVFAAPVITCPAAALASAGTDEIVLAVSIPSSVVGGVELLAEIVTNGADVDDSNQKASLKVTVNRSTVVVDEDFETGADGGWSSDQRSTTPEGNRGFLGEFGNQRVTFEAHDLPAHSQVTISFDLFIIRSWDGNNQVEGPDQWVMELDGVKLLDTTFSNWPNDLWQQAYPGNYPAANFPAQTGAEEVNSLGYLYGSDWLEMDAVYHIEMTLGHSSDDLLVALEGLGLSGLSEESWGVDNFKITLSGQQEHRIFLPMVLR